MILLQKDTLDVCSQLQVTSRLPLYREASGVLISFTNLTAQGLGCFLHDVTRAQVWLQDCGDVGCGRTDISQRSSRVLTFDFLRLLKIIWHYIPPTHKKLKNTPQAMFPKLDMVAHVCVGVVGGLRSSLAAAGSNSLNFLINKWSQTTIWRRPRSCACACVESGWQAPGPVGFHPFKQPPHLPGCWGHKDRKSQSRNIIVTLNFKILSTLCLCFFPWLSLSLCSNALTPGDPSKLPHPFPVPAFTAAHMCCSCKAKHMGDFYFRNKGWFILSLSERLEFLFHRVSETQPEV